MAVQIVGQAQFPPRANMAHFSNFTLNTPFTVPSQFPLSQSQSQPQPGQHLLQPALSSLSNPTQIANIMSSLDGPSLQSLLGALQQTQMNPQIQLPAFSTAPGNQPIGLSGLLNNLIRAQNPAGPVLSQSSLSSVPNQPFGLQIPRKPTGIDPNLLALLAQNLSNSKHQQSPSSSDPQFQNLSHNISRWKQ